MNQVMLSGMATLCLGDTEEGEQGEGARIMWDVIIQSIFPPGNGSQSISGSEEARLEMGLDK